MTTRLGKKMGPRLRESCLLTPSGRGGRVHALSPNSVSLIGLTGCLNDFWVGNEMRDPRAAIVGPRLRETCLLTPSGRGGRVHALSPNSVSLIGLTGCLNDFWVGNEMRDENQGWDSNT